MTRDELMDKLFGMYLADPEDVDEAMVYIDQYRNAGYSKGFDAGFSEGADHY
jgi:hypothetical protein